MILFNQPICSVKQMIPHEVNGNPVRFIAIINPPQFPRGYPEDRDLERTTAFLISISDEGSEEDRRFWVTCLGASGRLMAGDMCYTLESAKMFPKTEFDLDCLEWERIPE